MDAPRFLALRARSSTQREIAAEAERRRVIDQFDRHDSWIAIGRRALEIYAEAIEARRADTRDLSDRPDCLTHPTSPDLPKQP